MTTHVFKYIVARLHLYAIIVSLPLPIAIIDSLLVQESHSQFPLDFIYMLGNKIESNKSLSAPKNYNLRAILKQTEKK